MTPQEKAERKRIRRYLKNEGIKPTDDAITNEYNKRNAAIDHNDAIRIDHVRDALIVRGINPDDEYIDNIVDSLFLDSLLPSFDFEERIDFYASHPWEAGRINFFSSTGNTQ